MGIARNIGTKLFLYDTRLHIFQDIPEKPEREMTDKINEVIFVFFLLNLQNF